MKDIKLLSTKMKHNVNHNFDFVFFYVAIVSGMYQIIYWLSTLYEIVPGDRA